jgi:NACalpha-BTF3-like transcription factor
MSNVTNLAEKKEEKMDAGFADMLKATKTDTPKPKAKSKGSKTLVVDDNVKTAIDTFVKAKAAKKKAEAEMKATEPTVLTVAREHQDTEAFNGSFAKSYDIAGHEEKVKFVASDRFTVNGDDVANIKEVLGDDGYGELMEEDVEMVVKKAVFSDPELQKALAKALGSRAGEFFETRVTLTTKKGFDEKVYKHVKDADDLNLLRTFVKPYKPSLR